MRHSELHAVTGAFGYSGRYITQRLLADGKAVITLTNSLQRANPFGDRILVAPFDFDHPDRLVESLRDVRVLYNTYWVRFNHRTFTYSDAIRDTKILFQAAKAAGVDRVVHVSITNPSEDSPLEYFRGKGYLERVLMESGLPYTILRPAVLFGKEDILINNLAWVLRHFPVFAVFGDGEYKIQPIHVDDLAALAVEQGQRTSNEVVDAIGPETFTYRGLVQAVGEIIGRPRPIIGVPSSLGYVAGWIIGMMVNDVVITREEIKGLMANLLYVESKPAGKTKLTEWARGHSATLGLHYTSELARRKDRESEYRSN